MLGRGFGLLRTFFFGDLFSGWVGGSKGDWRRVSESAIPKVCVCVCAALEP